LPAAVSVSSSPLRLSGLCCWWLTDTYIQSTHTNSWWLWCWYGTAACINHQSHHVRVGVSSEWVHACMVLNGVLRGRVFDMGQITPQPCSWVSATYRWCLMENLFSLSRQWPNALPPRFSGACLISRLSVARPASHAQGQPQPGCREQLLLFDSTVPQMSQAMQRMCLICMCQRHEYLASSNM
jgi:hypothetical protein